MPILEGVVKYQLSFTKAELNNSLPIANMQRCFKRCRAAELIGQNSALYDGYAYGNISQRVEQGFLVSATQTGGFDELLPEHICLVEDFSLSKNLLRARGLFKPSSEAMTHGHLYQLRPECHFIIHVHSTILWKNAASLNMPLTDPKAKYGTPAMAEEVEKLLASDWLSGSGIFAMGGHQDGIVAFGSQAHAVEDELFKALNLVS